MIGKFIYLTITRPKISFVDGLLNQFMHKLREIHQKTTLRILV